MNWLTKLSFILKADLKRSIASKKGEPKRVRIRGRYAAKPKDGFNENKFRRDMHKVTIPDYTSFISPEGDIYDSGMLDHISRIYSVLSPAKKKELNADYYDGEGGKFYEIVFDRGWGRMVSQESNGKKELAVMFGVTPNHEQKKLLRDLSVMYDDVIIETDAGVYSNIERGLSFLPLRAFFS